MAFIPVPNTARVCWHFTFAGQQVQFCLHFEKLTPPLTTSDLTNLGSTGHTWWTGFGLVNFSQQMALNRVSATDLTSQSAPSIDTIVSPVEPGGVGQFPPLATAIVLTQRTALRGRSFRGRVYLPGVPTAPGADSAHAAAATITDILADFASLIASMEALATNGFEWVVVSKQQNGLPLGIGVTTPATVLSSDGNWRSQRRREFGVGI